MEINRILYRGNHLSFNELQVSVSLALYFLIFFFLKLEIGGGNPIPLGAESTMCVLLLSPDQYPVLNCFSFYKKVQLIAWNT